MPLPIVTRFAPSPTGFLHIGGARTALFNWAFARKHGGTMLLRIEDTDRERSTDQAVAAIIDGLQWLGLKWDGDIISQYSRKARHQEVAAQLLAAGHAYHCYCSRQELEAMRMRAETEKRSFRYDGTWRDRTSSSAPPNVAPAVRFKAPQSGETIIDDQVQGRVSFANKDLDDLIILRSDGNPTYNLAVVVDDHDTAVTHIIRGVDHLTNAARQAQLYHAMGWEIPTMAHIPLIHGPDGAKLSKRHGALGIEAYRDMGYLPEALRNYLARLGWSHGDAEIFSTQQLIDWFSLEKIGRSPARFDFAKLENLNGHYLRISDDPALLTMLEPLVPPMEPPKRAQLLSALPGLKGRAKNLVELAKSAHFLFVQRPISYDEKALALLGPEARTYLAKILPILETIPDWQEAILEATLKAETERLGIKLSQIAQPLRAALTGSATSPGIFNVLAILGRDESLARIKDASTTR